MTFRFHRAWPLVALVSACSPNATPTTTAAETTTKPVAMPPPAVELDLALPEIPRDEREPLIARGVSSFLSRQHLRHHPIDDAVSREAFSEYLERIDGAKLFLLQPQVDELRKLETDMDDEVEAGNLRLARIGTGVMSQRRDVVAKMVAELVAQPFDFAREESVETDPDKLSFVADDAQLRERWRMLLKLQVLERIHQMEELEKDLAEGTAKDKDKNGEGGGAPMEPPPPTFEGKEKKAREELATSYAARFKRQANIDPLAPTEEFLNSIAATFDPHTVYLAPAEKANFDISMSGSLEGIGAALGVKDHYIEVRELVPGGASWKQGELEAGDLILAVGQANGKAVDVTDMPIDTVVQMIRGRKGTVVRLTVKKPDGRVRVISITRDVVVIEAAYARGAILEGESGQVGYVNLPSFYGNTRANASPNERNATDDVRAILEIFQKRKLPGVVLDLRGNGGGLLAHARDITGLFIPWGPVVQSRDTDGTPDVEADLQDEAVEVTYGGKVIVLVDRFSASASEIVAGALQDYQRAVVVGTGPTHGKGTVQVIVDLDRMKPSDVGPSLGVLKITVQQYFRITGESTQVRGVIPDVVLPDPAGYIESGERFLDHPVPWSAVDALQFEPWKGNHTPTPRLVEKSAARVAAEPVFDKVNKRNTLLEARRKDTRVPLSRDAWLARRAESDAALEAVDAKLDEGPERFKVTPIVYGKGTAPNDDRVKKRLEQWRKDLGHDPWLQETLRVLGDMH